MSSVLNPEAPEFQPHLRSFTQNAFSSLHGSIRLSNCFPKGLSYELFKTFSDFNIVVCNLSENVVMQSNIIIITELPAVTLRLNDMDYNTEKIIDANDSMLDRINVNLDNMGRKNNPNSKIDGAVYGSNMTNNAPVIALIKIGSATFIGAKNIPRPQLSFKDRIDNSESLWVPKISDKPNNIKPLALNIIYNENGEAVGYEHPYQVELDLYVPPAEFLEVDPHPPKFPPELEHTPCTYIDTKTQMDALVEHLSNVKEIAVDVEHHSYRTYQGISCLIQISTPEADFVIDALAIREHVHKLNLSFTDPKKIKIFHGADMDVLWLQRDFGVYIVGLFDTHQAAKVLNITTGMGLKNLLWRYCRVDINKEYQLADWRIRPLPDKLIEYARMDTHYLLYIWRKMKEELLEMAAGQPNLLTSVFENSRQICGTTYNKPVLDENSHLSLYLRSKKMFNSRQLAALAMLYKYRDSEARLLDESTTYLLPNHMLLALAETLPREVQGVNAICSPMPPFVKQNLITIHRMLLSCRELPIQPQFYPLPMASNHMINVHLKADSLKVHEPVEHQEQYAREQAMVDQANLVIDQLYDTQPLAESVNRDQPIVSKTKSTVIVTTVGDRKAIIVSNLNVYAEKFIPPFGRLRPYRTAAEEDEMKEFKEKEAKIVAISKGNELIKKEVLEKLQETKSVKIDDKKNTDDTIEEDITDIIEDKSCSTNKFSKSQKASKMKKARKAEKAAVRKKKALAEKERVELAAREQNEQSKKNTGKGKNNKMDYKVKQKSEAVANVKPFNYKNVNYRKFHDDDERPQKMPKQKYKKHK